MKKRLKISPARFIKEEAGQALILMLIFLVMGSLTLVPTLAYMRTALKTSTNYEHKTNAYYAADAGIEDAVWQIKYDGLEALFGSPSFNYDFNTVAEYPLDEPVNDLITNVTIQSVWIPSNVSPPDD